MFSTLKIVQNFPNGFHIETFVQILDCGKSWIFWTFDIQYLSRSRKEIIDFP